MLKEKIQTIDYGTIRPPHLMKSVDVLNKLRVNAAQGLDSKIAKKRLFELGENVIPKKKQSSSVMQFLSRLKDPLVLLLLAAGIFSLLIDRVADAVIISFTLVLDASLSYAQTLKAERTLDRLRQHVEQRANVIRDGVTKKIVAKQLVVGDIIELRAGDKVPADARLFTSRGLKVQEATLTGESDDIEKSIETITGRTPLGNRRNMVYMGTIVMSGSGKAVVVATGVKTEFGKIAQLLRGEKSPSSPLKQKLKKVGFKISILVTVTVVIIAALDFWRGDTLIRSLRTAATLIVSALPEDLTIILTIALTVGVIRLLRRGAVVKNLDSAEALGSATVICVDKTGTITQGEMKAQSFYSLQGCVVSHEVAPQSPMISLGLIGFALASDAHRINNNKTHYLGSATERAALEFTEYFGLIQDTLRQQWRQRDAIVFDSKWKYRASLHDHPTKPTQVLFVSGAPDVLLNKSSFVLDKNNTPTPITTKKRVEMTKLINEKSSRGERLLAVAVRRNFSQTHITHDDVDQMLFIGVLTMKDPVRPEIYQAIKATQAAGVAVKIITGDYQSTARAVARDVGLIVSQDEIITGDFLEDMNSDELKNIVNDITIFARVSPTDKQRIIRALQSKGHIVVMTGDGVNDAVALKSADLGVAMGSGKDIAKDASDLVILNNSFATIVAAIKEGRIIKDNIRKVISFLLAHNTSEVGIFLTSLAIGLPLPLIPAQILWMNIVTDGTSDIALALEPAEKNTMKHKPEHPQAPLMNKTLIAHILFSGLAITIMATSLYWYLFKYTNTNLTYSRTMVFAFMSVVSILSTWSWRSLRSFIPTRGFWQNPWIILSGIFSFGLQLLVIYVPAFQVFFETVSLTMNDWILITALSVVTVIIIDLRKLLPVPQSESTIRSSSKTVPEIV